MRRAVVLAGGKGTRLAPFTVTFPKPLMPLDDTPILEVVLRQLKRDGFDRVTLAVGHLAELIESYFGDGSKVGVELDYCREDEPLGTAGALALVENLDDPFLVMNGDILTTMDYGAFLDGHANSNAVLSISTQRRESRVDFGIIEHDGEVVTGYVEKPTSEFLVSMGVYAFSRKALESIEHGERVDFPDVVLRLLGAGAFVRSVPFDGYWLDIGRPDDFARAQSDFGHMRERFLQGEGA